MIGALAQKSWITYYKDKDLSIAFDDVVRVEDVIVEPYLGKKERKALLKKPYRLSNGVWTRVEYKDEIPYTFFIPTGYRWNGANVPFGLYHLVGAPSDPRFKVASMVHDFLCENKFVIDGNRYLSSRIFKGLLKEAGVGGFKRFLMFHAVDNYQKFCGWNKRKY